MYYRSKRASLKKLKKINYPTTLVMVELVFLYIFNTFKFFIFYNYSCSLNITYFKNNFGSSKKIRLVLIGCTPLTNCQKPKQSKFIRYFKEAINLFDCVTCNTKLPVWYYHIKHFFLFYFGTYKLSIKIVFLLFSTCKYEII